MKQYIFTFLVLCLSASVFAQRDFQGRAVYESKTSMGDFSKMMPKNREITPEMQKMIEDRVKKMLEKTFVLDFDRSASTYKEEEKLDATGNNQMNRMFSSMSGLGGVYYKNVKEKTFTVDKEFMGKEFLVKDSLSNYDWKMESETKQIGGYTCYKATAVKKLEATDFKNMVPKKDADLSQEKKEEKQTNFFDNFEVPSEIIITAWYTPEIPVNQGPGEFWGLPGLILEVNDGKTVILCSKIVMNPKEKTRIIAPKNGKVVTQSEFDKIMMDKMKELQESGPGGRGFQMRMGR